jgi:hypothetical protein
MVEPKLKSQHRPEEYAKFYADLYKEATTRLKGGCYQFGDLICQHILHFLVAMQVIEKHPDLMDMAIFCSGTACMKRLAPKYNIWEEQRQEIVLRDAACKAGLTHSRIESTCCEMGKSEGRRKQYVEMIFCNEPLYKARENTAKNIEVQQLRAGSKSSTWETFLAPTYTTRSPTATENNCPWWKLLGEDDAARNAKILLLSDKTKNNNIISVDDETLNITNDDDSSYASYEINSVSNSRKRQRKENSLFQSLPNKKMTPQHAVTLLTKHSDPFGYIELYREHTNGNFLRNASVLQKRKFITIWSPRDPYLKQEEKQKATRRDEGPQYMADWNSLRKQSQLLHLSLKEINLLGKLKKQNIITLLGETEMEQVAVFHRLWRKSELVAALGLALNKICHTGRQRIIDIIRDNNRDSAKRKSRRRIPCPSNTVGLDVNVSNYEYLRRGVAERKKRFNDNINQESEIDSEEEDHSDSTYKDENENEQEDDESLMEDNTILQSFNGPDDNNDLESFSNNNRQCADVLSEFMLDDETVSLEILNEDDEKVILIDGMEMPIVAGQKHITLTYNGLKRKRCLPITPPDFIYIRDKCHHRTCFEQSLLASLATGTADGFIDTYPPVPTKGANSLDARMGRVVNLSMELGIDYSSIIVYTAYNKRWEKMVFWCQVVPLVINFGEGCLEVTSCTVRNKTKKVLLFGTRKAATTHYLLNRYVWRNLKKLRIEAKQNTRMEGNFVYHLWQHGDHKCYCDFVTNDRGKVILCPPQGCDYTL